MVGVRKRTPQIIENGKEFFAIKEAEKMHQYLFIMKIITHLGFIAIHECPAD